MKSVVLQLKQNRQTKQDKTDDFMLGSNVDLVSYFKCDFFQNFPFLSYVKEQCLSLS